MRDKTNGYVCENRAQLVTVELEEAAVEENGHNLLWCVASV